jgi:putative ABC transport system ATP-binding protein
MLEPVTPETAANTTATPTLEARGLTKVYRTGEVEVHALRGVDVAFYPGELIVLLGPSGSGKSTLLNILGGLDAPTSGEVRFRGAPLPADDQAMLTRFRRDHVGFVFQFYNLVASLTAEENVELVTEIAPAPMRPGEALGMVGLGERRDAFPTQLSGGEQQRVAIARAIAKRPELLLCDEPTGALDRETGLLVLEAIASVNREFGTTTALITHNSVIARMADRVLRLADGTVVDEVRNAVRAAPSELEW